MYALKKGKYFWCFKLFFQIDAISSCAAATMHTPYKALPMYSVKREVC